MSIRDELIEKAAVILWETDLSGVAAVLKWDSVSNQASYRRQAAAVIDAIMPQITAVEDVRALPDRALVVTANGEPLVTRGGGLWHNEDDDYWYAPWYTRDSLTRLAPLTVVWRP